MKKEEFEINKIYLEKHLRDQSTILKYFGIGLFASYLAYATGRLGRIESSSIMIGIIILSTAMFLASRRKEEEAVEILKSHTSN